MKYVIILIVLCLLFIFGCKSTLQNEAVHTGVVERLTDSRITVGGNIYKIFSWDVAPFAVVGDTIKYRVSEYKEHDNKWVVFQILSVNGNVIEN